MLTAAIDLGGTKIKLGLLRDHQVLEIRTFPSMEKMGLGNRLPGIEECINSLLRTHRRHGEDFSGIGIGFPGIVNTRENRVLSTPKYKDASELDLNKWAERSWSVPLRMDNDSRLACLGEWKSGAGRGVDDLVIVTFGTGFGSSAVMEGRLIRGAHYQAGILGGHSSVDFKGESCICGNRGCVETLASSWALPGIIGRQRDEPNAYRGDADYYSLFEAYRRGDKAAVKLVDGFMDSWGAALVNLIHAYDPQLVILGGGVMNSGDIILPAMKARIEKYAWLPWGMVELKASVLGDMAALVGGSCLFLED